VERAGRQEIQPDGEGELTKFLDLAWSAIAAVARVAIWLGGAMLFIAAGIVTAEVLLRKGTGALFGWSFVFSGSDEISAYLFAVGTAWSMTHVLVNRGHVRIDALYGAFGLRTRCVLDLVAMLALLVFAAALLERSWDVASTSVVDEIRSNTPLRVPLAWAQIPWFAGIALFALALLLGVLRSSWALIRGDLATASATAGAATMDDEIETELKGLGIGPARDAPGR
jgi:TRAP-type C4-dicarboxylate transport system permease small subunit